MKTALQKIPGILGSRAARNVYFWMFAVSLHFNQDDTVPQALFTTVLYALLIILSYTNNLVLAPLLLAKKKYWTYVFMAISLCFLIALCYDFTLKLMLHYYPDPSASSVDGAISKVSVITQLHNTSNLSFRSLLNETSFYFLSLLAWTSFFTMAWYAVNSARNQKIAEEAKKKQVETELLFLKGQVNPHFLFNTLNNLYGLALRKSDTAPEAILKLSSILRYLLYESNSEKVAFSKEKEIMLAYIDLELLRLSKNDNFSFSISVDSPCDIPPLLWLPVLENVFKHGTRFINDDYMIDYRCSIQNGKLTIYSRNKYNSGTNSHSLEKTAGIGLANLKQRLEILYPAKYKMEAKHDNGYYIATVEIMLK